jgi:hypothetical protein
VPAWPSSCGRSERVALDRKRDAKARTGTFALEDLDSTAVLVDDLLDQREP